MLKTLTRSAAAMLAALLCASAATAQTTLEWIVLAPAAEEFTVRTPQQPASAEPQNLRVGGMSVMGTRYAASDDGQSSYVVWSLQSPDGALWQSLEAADKSEDKTKFGSFATLLYLDHIAELSWDLLVTPELERIKREESWWNRAEIKSRVGLTYVRSFTIGKKQAREYSISFQKRGGLVYICADAERIYIVAAHGVSAEDARLRQFVDSFAFKDAAPVPVPIPSTPVPTPGAPDGRTYGGGGGGGGRGTVDYERPFRQNQVTKRALVTGKPEPGFTKGARKFNVTGMVRLRAILHHSGEMRNIIVVKPLPHGLTEEALDAARRIRFKPAQKDGRLVSQYVILEYNFNVY